MEKKKKFVLKKQVLGNLSKADLDSVVGGAPRIPDVPRNPWTPGQPDPFFPG